MSFRLGALALPIGLFLLARKLPSPVGAFRKAGACSAATARKPASVGLSGAWLFEGAIRSGLIIATDDGRYWLDPVRDRARRRRFLLIGGGIVAASTAVLVWLVW